MRLLNRDIRDLAFASLNLPLAADALRSALREVESTARTAWYHCAFRGCDLLLVYGGGRVLDKDGLDWTDAARAMPALQGLIGALVGPYFTRFPRIIILRTRPEEELHWHVDCALDELDGFQPKLRVLLRGRRDELFYLARDGGKIRVEPDSDVYYMSGAFVHSARNRDRQDRYVLCFGSPWGEEDMRPEFLQSLSEGGVKLWSDGLQMEGREKFVRVPKKHALTPYAEY